MNAIGMATNGDVVTAERLQDGRFAPGHRFCGRSELAAAYQEKRRFLLESTDPRDCLAVLNAMRDMALMGGKGAPQAAALFLSYTAGRPEVAMDPEEASRTFDVVNLNKPAADLTIEQRRQRLAYLLAEQAKEKP